MFDLRILSWTSGKVWVSGRGWDWMNLAYIARHTIGVILY